MAESADNRGRENSAMPGQKARGDGLSSRRRCALLVVGMHRSGTSAIAGVLSRLGAEPPRTLGSPYEGQPARSLGVRQVQGVPRSPPPRCGKSMDGLGSVQSGLARVPERRQLPRGVSRPSGAGVRHDPSLYDEGPPCGSHRSLLDASPPAVGH